MNSPSYADYAEVFADMLSAKALVLVVVDGVHGTDAIAKTYALEGETRQDAAARLRQLAERLRAVARSMDREAGRIASGELPPGPDVVLAESDTTVSDVTPEKPGAK